MTKTEAPYGSWPSSVAVGGVTGATLRLDHAWVAGDAVLWTEGRPGEGGRTTVVRRDAAGTVTDLVPAPYDARTAAHEYGGLAALAWGDDLVFANRTDHRLYRVAPGDEPRALTPPGDVRYADLAADRRRGRILAVAEDHRDAGEAVNHLVAVPVEGGEPRVLAGGHDFLSNPRPSPDGDRVAWLTWDHPRMPWDGTDLWVAPVEGDGSLGDPEHVAGGPGESVFQPAWSPAGVLHLVTDRSGWWNLHRWDDGEVRNLHPVEAELGRPQWLFGMATYAFEDADRILVAVNRRGLWDLERLDAREGSLRTLDLPYTYLASVHAGPGGAVFLGGSSREPLSVVHLDPDAREHRILRRSAELDAHPGDLPELEVVSWPSMGGREAHGFLHRPRNHRFRGPAGEHPPLIVGSHGGPTSAYRGLLDPAIAFWTSRGFAYLAVNYGGSTGYGRAYREALEGAWGVVDVEDCAAGARHLAATGSVDGDRLVIRGWSAGGYTTLCALAFDDTFHGGTSLYGVTDLRTFAEDTHKFESRYLESLVGRWPEDADVYDARSPLRHADGIGVPALFLQGLEDTIVPPDQAERMVADLRGRGVPVAYLAFEGEGHGFRAEATLRRALLAELAFYGRILGIAPADEVPGLEIANLGEG